jgi:protein-S-isoprenylcysteine O-methyltransferase Ste14
VASLLLGIGVAVTGESIRLWASGHLQKNRTLTTSGPYAWTRNPLYLGSLFVGVGFCVASARPAFLAVLLALFAGVYFPVMKREASRLEASHPDGYRAYSDRVPLFLPAFRAFREPVAEDGGGRFSWARVVENREHQTLAGLVLVVAILAGKLAI